MPFWHRLVIVAVVLLVTALVARLIDRRIARRDYTFIRTDDGARLVIPNEKLASDTIRNSTIVSLEKVAEITVQVPLDKDLRTVVELLREAVAGERESKVTVTSLNGNATIVVRARAPGPIEAERLESDLRIRAHERLRAAGVFG